MKVWIESVQVYQPERAHTVVQDVAWAEGRLVAVADPGTIRDFTPDVKVAGQGLALSPGWVDLCARLKAPGRHGRGRMAQELAAAAAGGVTRLVCPADQGPPLDEPGLVETLIRQAQAQHASRVHPLGALTRRLEGQVLSELSALGDAGCIAFSQGDHPITDTQVLMRALQYAASFGDAVWLHPMDPYLSRGVAASGPVATRLGLSGVPAASEAIALHTVLTLVRSTGVPVHIQRLSSALGVALVQAAKAEGLPITADVSINSLLFTDMDLGYFDTALRLEPPVRQSRDREALQAAVRDGVIDAVVSDHHPLDADAKTLPFGEALPGATGLEMLLGATLHWGRGQGLSWGAALSAITQGPLRVLKRTRADLPPGLGEWRVGAPADLCLFDPDAEVSIHPHELVSQGKHTPFLASRTGMALPGRVLGTWVQGELVFARAGGPVDRL